MTQPDAARSDVLGIAQTAMPTELHSHPAIETLVRLLSRQAAAERVRAASTEATSNKETSAYDHHE